MPPATQQSLSARRFAKRRYRLAIRAVLAALVCVMTGTEASAYELDFHYYTVYLILRARGYPPTEADTLAGFSQYIDDNGRTEPLYCLASTRARFHFAGSDDQTATQEDLVDAQAGLESAFKIYAAGRSTGRYVVGATLHLLADTFSHAGFTAWRNRAINCREYSFRPCIGHADAPDSGHRPDYPFRDTAMAMRAAESIYKIVPPQPNPNAIAWTTLQPDLERTLTRVDLQTNAVARAEAVQILIIRLCNEKPTYDKVKFKHEQDAFNAALGR